MTTKEKIKYYIDSKGISKNKFYTITGLSTSFLDSGNTIGVDKAKIIIEKFPDLSLEWLVLDRGPMLANNKVPEEKNDKNSERIDKLLDIGRLPAKDDRIISPKRGCGGCAGCCWQGGTRIKQPERFILTPDYPIKDAARPHNLDTTATTKRITKLDILLFHAFAE